MAKQQQPYMPLPIPGRPEIAPAPGERAVPIEIEGEEVERHEFKGSHIDWGIYDSKSRQCQVGFKQSGTDSKGRKHTTRFLGPYLYSGVSQKEWENWKKAASPGTYFRRIIKRKPFV